MRTTTPRSYIHLRGILKIKFNLFILFGLVLITGITTAQVQEIKSTIQSSPSNVLRFTEGHINDGNIKSECILLNQVLPENDTLGVKLVIEDGLNEGTEVEFHLFSAQDTFAFKIDGYELRTLSDSILSYDSLAIGDSITILRLDDWIYLVQNMYVVYEEPYSNTDTDFSGKIISVETDDFQSSFLFDSTVQFEFLDTVYLEFIDTLIAINEGESLDACISRLGGSRPISMTLNLLNPVDPHFDSFSPIMITSGLDTFCTMINSDVANTLSDSNTSYIFELIPTSQRTFVGTRNRLHVVISDDVQDTVPPLCPADLIISAVDNNVGTYDRVSITALSPLEPNTSFSLANAIYELRENATGRWYASDVNKSPLINSQNITYTGTTTLPAGSVICLDIPSTGTDTALLVRNFEINGTISTDFIVVNDGNTADPDISLSIDHPEALFVVQGTWDFNPEYAQLFGPVIHGVQIGNDWLTDFFSNPAFISDVPEDLTCFYADWGGDLEVAVYYDCEGTLSVTSKFTVMAEISDASNWIFKTSTSAMDLPIDICSMQCEIENLDTIWYISVKDLVLPCAQEENYTSDINTWLNNHGNGMAYSSCGIESTINDFDSLDSICGITTMTDVIFTAIDSCGNQFSDTAMIIIQDDTPPVWERSIIPLTMYCPDSLSADSMITAWLDSIGPDHVFDQCHSVTITNDYVPTIIPCDTTIVVHFTAMDDCGNTSYDSSFIQIQDLDAPYFIDYPQDLFLVCNDTNLVNIPDSIDQWLQAFGYGSAADACGDVEWIISVPDSLDQLMCPVDTSILVSFYVHDECSNFHSANAYIHIKSGTNICDTTIHLTQIADTLALLGFECEGVKNITWEFQASGDSIWYHMVMTPDTLLPAYAGQGYYRATSTCHNECEISKTIYYPVCDSLNMVLEDSAIGIKWGELYYGSTPVEDYLISWRDAQGNEVFQSAAGIFYNDSLTLPHPLPVFQPVVPGKYFPVVINSIYGPDLACFDTLEVDQLECGNEYVFKYEGAGGALASHQTAFTIGDTTILKFWFETANNNPDRLLAIYMGDTIFDTGLVQWNSARIRVLEVPHTPGFDTVSISIINQGNPAHETKYTMKVKCCGPIIECSDIPLADVTVTSLTTDSNGKCTATLTTDSTWNRQYFWDNYCIGLNSILYPNKYALTPGQFTCNQTTVASDFTCQSSTSTVEIANLASEGYTQGAGFVIDFPSDLSGVYNNMKSWVTNYEDSALYAIEFNLLKYNCEDDLTGQTNFEFNPFIGSATFNDSENKMIFVFKDENPYDSLMLDCFHSTYGLYSSLGYNSSHSYFSDEYETVDWYAVRRSTYSYKPFSYNQSVKSLGTPGCNLTFRYQLNAFDTLCPCDTWYFVQDTTEDSSTGYDFILDSAGPTTCPLPDIVQPQSESNSIVRDDYFRIFPNPTKGVLNIDFSSDVGEDIKINVMDLSGKLVQQIDYYTIQGFNRTTIDLESIPGGMYLLHLQGEKTNRSDRFILMR